MTSDVDVHIHLLAQALREAGLVSLGISVALLLDDDGDE